MARAPKVEVERPPEDALPDVELPRQTGILVGHKAAEQTLLDAYRSGRMHHAWLIAGAPGIGRATLAFRFARFVLAHPDPGIGRCPLGDRSRDIRGEPGGAPRRRRRASQSPASAPGMELEVGPLPELDRRRRDAEDHPFPRHDGGRIRRLADRPRRSARRHDAERCERAPEEPRGAAGKNSVPAGVPQPRLRPSDHRLALPDAAAGAAQRGGDRAGGGERVAGRRRCAAIGTSPRASPMAVPGD